MFLKNLILAGLALSSFLLTSGWIRSQLPPDPGDERAMKLAYLAEHAPGATALIFGSSVILHGVIPQIVDELAGEVEPDFRCLNAGVSGMRDFEEDQFIREVLELPGVNPRWIFVSPSEFRVTVPERYLDTDRTLRWHDFRQTSRALLLSLEGLQPELRVDNDWAMYHVRKYFHRLSNYGQIERLLGGLGTYEPTFPVDEGTLAEAGGFLPIEVALGRVGELHAMSFPDQMEEYERRVAELPNKPMRSLTKASLALFRRQQAWLEQQADHLIYLMPPYPYGGLYAGQLHRDGEAPYCIDFVQPLVYPELYAIEHRYDPYHTNLDGAKVFSRLLGERIAEELTKIRADEEMAALEAR